MTAGVAAKLLIKAKGPYRVVELVGEGSYRIQRLPFCQGLGQCGQLIKESAARMEKIPSMLVVHKKADGTDTRLAMLKGPFLRSPLEKWLGVLEQGTYQQARADQDWAFEPVGDLWPEDSIESESEEENDDGLGVPTTDKCGVRRERAEASARGRTKQIQMIPKTDWKAMKELYEAVKTSGDRLCFIQFQVEGTTSPSWYLVQVDLDETDPVLASTWGTYRCKWLTKCYKDSMK